MMFPSVCVCVWGVVQDKEDRTQGTQPHYRHLVNQNPNQLERAACTGALEQTMRMKDRESAVKLCIQGNLGAT